ARFARAALRGAERAPPPDKVAHAVWRALTGRRPPLRMVVTPHRLDRLSLWIPDRLLDWLIYRFLWKKRVTPPAPASGRGGGGGPLRRVRRAAGGGWAARPARPPPSPEARRPAGSARRRPG